jgi:hypothetical protein
LHPPSSGRPPREATSSGPLRHHVLLPRRQSVTTLTVQSARRILTCGAALRCTGQAQVVGICVGGGRCTEFVARAPSLPTKIQAAADALDRVWSAPFQAAPPRPGLAPAAPACPPSAVPPTAPRPRRGRCGGAETPAARPRRARPWEGPSIRGLRSAPVRAAAARSWPLPWWLVLRRRAAATWAPALWGRPPQYQAGGASRAKACLQERSGSRRAPAVGPEGG